MLAWQLSYLQKPAEVVAQWFHIGDILQSGFELEPKFLS